MKDGAKQTTIITNRPATAPMKLPFGLLGGVYYKPSGPRKYFLPLVGLAVDPCSRLYIGLPSITAVPVGDFVRTVWVSLKPADR